MIDQLSFRLRELRDRNNWTVADMAERTGIPKRTLDKYMLRTGASLPGFDALCSLSKGLGVSLDWLVFGSETASDDAELIAFRTAHYVVSLFTEALLRSHLEGRKDIFTSEEIVTMTPEEWAHDLGERAASKARELLSSGVTRAELLAWRQLSGERSVEKLKDRIAQVLAAKEPT
jgi:transcriptional regulator with XRE-family HTH domain